MIRDLLGLIYVLLLGCSLAFVATSFVRMVQALLEKDDNE